MRPIPQYFRLAVYGKQWAEIEKQSEIVFKNTGNIIDPNLVTADLIFAYIADFDLAEMEQFLISQEFPVVDKVPEGASIGNVCLDKHWGRATSYYKKDDALKFLGKYFTGPQFPQQEPVSSYSNDGIPRFFRLAVYGNKPHEIEDVSSIIFENKDGIINPRTIDADMIFRFICNYSLKTMERFLMDQGFPVRTEQDLPEGYSISTICLDKYFDIQTKRFTPRQAQEYLLRHFSSDAVKFR